MSEHYQEIRRSYKLLGLEIGTPLEIVRKNYLELIKAWHPDVSAEPEAEGKAQEINEALTKIKSLSSLDIRAAKRHFKSHRRRSKYRRKRKKYAARPAPPPPQPSPRPAAKADETAARADRARHSRHRRSKHPVSRRGRHFFGDLEITQSQAAAGSRWRFKIATCNRCAGWGAAMGADFQICRDCRGMGLERHGDYYDPSAFCRRCEGRGSTYAQACDACDGSGESDHYTVRCYIPPGNGGPYVGIIDGLGHRGVRGGKAGDLYLRVSIRDG